MTVLDRVRQEALEDGNSVERLTEELDKLRMDQEALASRKGEVIAELKDKACTQWAFGVACLPTPGFLSFPRPRVQHLAF